MIGRLSELRRLPIIVLTIRAQNLIVMLGVNEPSLIHFDLVEIEFIDYDPSDPPTVVKRIMCLLIASLVATGKLRLQAA